MSGINFTKKELNDKYGEDAIFVTASGFSINVFEDEWVVDGKSGGTTLDLSVLNSENWDKETHCEVRLAIGWLTTKYAPTTLHNDLLYISRCKNLDIVNIHNFPSLFQCGHTRQAFIRLVKGLVRINKDKYQASLDWLKSSTKPKHHVRNPYDIRTGALNEFERISFEQSLSKLVQKGINRYNKKPCETSLRFLRGVMVLRLMYVFVRRPANLIQLKWSDMIPIGKSFNKGSHVEINEPVFSDEEQLHVRMWKAKTGASFRKHVEKNSLILNEKYSQEVLFYRNAYKDQLRKRINELNISINEDELNVLFLRCPVFYYTEVFKAKFKTTEQLFRGLSVDGEGFHLSSQALLIVSSWSQNRLGVDSDRISDIRVGNNRIRHTVGTNAAMLGYDAMHIAQLLGNTAGSAQIYIDLSDEQRAKVDNKFVSSIELKKMVNVSIQELQKDERFTISDEFGNSIGSPKISQTCVNCNEPRPIGCYGCPNFIALVGGNHRAIRDRAQQLYDARVSMGQHKVSLVKLATQIKWIDMTIEVCEEREMLNG